jgi:polyisoprenoid-binding protein YceI
MKAKTKKITKTWIITIAALFVVLSAAGQANYKQNGTSSITIAGTSTMHDWTMTSKEANYTATFELNADGTPSKLNMVTVSIPAESLKSGKGAMDKNAYNSLKTDKHKQIVFQLTSARINAKTISCSGNLTVAGTTKPIEMEVSYEDRNGTLYCKGAKNIKMTDYNVEPPTFMFGSIKTGNEITVSIEVSLAQIKL